MKFFYLIICIFLESFFISSCNSTGKTYNEKETETILNGSRKANLAQTNDSVVILPGLGYNGCSQEGEAFMQDFIDSTGIFFILTKVQSIKILQHKIGKSVLNRKNVYIDRQGDFEIPTNNTIYPCIVRLKDGKIINHQFQSPSNSQAFEKLKVQME